MRIDHVNSTGIITAGDNSNNHIVSPGGGRTYISGNNTGALQIIIPTSWVDVDVSFEISINSSNAPLMELTINGSLESIGPQWANVGAALYGHSPDTAVKFGTDGTNPVIWIGETDHSYNDVKVMVHNVNIAGGAFNLDEIKDGWSISVVPTIASPSVIQQTVESTKTSSGDDTGSYTRIQSDGTYFKLEDLYSSNELGAWLDPYDISTLYQDGTIATPVTVEGDPVGAITDKATNSIANGIQTVSAQRPTYQIDGVYKGLLFDGIDDNLNIQVADGIYEVFIGSSKGTLNYTVSISGGGGFNLYSTPSDVIHDNVTGIVVVDSVTDQERDFVVKYLQNRSQVADFSSTTNFNNIMQNQSNMVTFNGTIVDTSNVTIMSRMFSTCSNLTSVDLSNWVTSNVTDCTRMFFNCGNLTSVNTSGWDTSGVSFFTYFIWNCSSLVDLDVSRWDTSSATTFNNFAYNCNSLTTLDVSNWNTSNVANFGSFTWACSSLTALDVSRWDTSSLVTADRFCQNCGSLTTLDVSNWNTINVTNLGNFMANSGIDRLDVSNWNTANVSILEYFASGCSSLTELDVSGWNTSSVTSVRGFIRNCTLLETLDVSNWGTPNLTTLSDFADGCSSLKALDVSGWTTTGVSSFDSFISGCSSLTEIDLSNWNTSSAVTFNNFASGCTSLTTVVINGGTGNPLTDNLCTNYSNAFANTALTQQSIDDILVAIELANTSTGTFNQSGGSAPSSIGEAAIDSLRLRGWSISVTGGY